MGLLKRNIPPYDTFLFRSAPRPLSEAVCVWINGNVIVGNLAPGPSAIVAEYAGAPAGRGYDVWREDVCRNFCRIDAEPSAGGQIFCKVEIVKVSSLALATAGGT